MELHLRTHSHYFHHHHPLSLGPSAGLYLLGMAPIVIVLICFLKWDSALDPHEYRYNTSISVNERWRKIITIGATVLHALVGLLATVLKVWSLDCWMAYLLVSIAFAVYIWVFQVNKPHTLFGSCAALFFMAGYLQKLLYLFIVHHRYHHHRANSLVVNLLAAELGWLVIWTLAVLGQVMVHDARFMKQQTQTVVFVVFSLLVMASFIALNLHIGCTILQMVTFLATAVCTIVFFFWNRWSKNRAEPESLRDYEGE